jgi:hypothetical protein
MTNPEIKVTNETVDGTDMVKIAVGSEVVMLDINSAFGLARLIEGVAGFSAFSNSLDNLFGDEGGTC